LDCFPYMLHTDTHTYRIKKKKKEIWTILFLFFLQTIGSLPNKFSDAYLVISRLKRQKKNEKLFFFFLSLPTTPPSFIPSARYT
jgi:hypothetical protein